MVSYEFVQVNVNWPTAVADKADMVSSVSASACHIGGPIGVNPGELALVYGTTNYITIGISNFLLHSLQSSSFDCFIHCNETGSFSTLFPNDIKKKFLLYSLQ